MAVGTVSIAFDYREHLKKAYEDIEKTFNELGSSMVMSDEFKKQIDDCKKLLFGLKEDTTDAFKGLASGKLDTDKFNTFRTRVNANLKRVDEEIEKINASITVLNTALGVSGDNVNLSNAINQFKELQKFINANNEAVVALLNTVNQASSDIAVKFKLPSFSIGDARAQIASIRKASDALGEETDFGSKGAEELTQAFSMVSTKMSELIEKKKELASELSSTDKDSPMFVKLKSDLVLAELELQSFAEQLQDIYSVAEDKKLNWNAIVDRKKLNNDAIAITDTLNRVQANARNMVGELNAYIESMSTATARLSNKLNPNTGEVNIGVKISTKDSTLLKELKDKLSILQSYLMTNPLIFPVKMVIANAITQSDNPLKTTQHQIEQAQKMLRDSDQLISVKTDGLYKQTLQQALKYAESTVSESLIRINERLAENPATVHLQVPQEEIDKISDSLFQNGETKINISNQLDIAQKKLKNLADQLINVKNQYKDLANEIKNSLNEIGNIKDILVAIRDFEDVMSRATGASKNSDIDAQWNKIKFWYDYITDKEGKLDFSKQTSQIATLMNEYRKYVNMGGKNPLRSLSADEEIVKKLYEEFNKLNSVAINNEEIKNEVTSVGMVTGAVTDLTKAIGTTKVQAIKTEAAEMENAAKREVAAIRTVEQEITRIIEQLTNNSEFKVNIVPIINSKDFSEKLSGLMVQTFSNNEMTFEKQKNAISDGITKIIFDMLDADRIMKNAKNTVYERPLFFNKETGYHTNQMVVGDKYSVDGKLLDDLFKEAQNIGQALNTMLHTHPTKYAQMSFATYENGNVGGDFLTFYDFYKNKRGINEQIVTAQENAQIFQSKKFFDDYKQINFASKAIQKEIADIYKSIDSQGIENSINLSLDLFKTISKFEDFFMNINKILPVGLGSKTNRELNAIIKTSFSENADNTGEQLTKHFLDYALKKKDEFNGSITDLYETYIKELLSSIENAGKIKDLKINKSAINKYADEAARNFMLYMNDLLRLNGKYGQQRVEVTSNEAWDQFLKKKNITPKGTNKSIHDLENYYERIKIDEFYERYKSVSNLKEEVSKNTDYSTLGKQVGQGYAQGIRDSIPEVEQAVKDLIQAGITAAANAQDSHSPSEVYRKLGKDAADGYILGIKDKISEIANAATEVMQTGINNAKSQEQKKSKNNDSENKDNDNLREKDKLLDDIIFKTNLLIKNKNKTIFPEKRTDYEFGYLYDDKKYEERKTQAVADNYKNIVSVITSAKEARPTLFEDLVKESEKLTSLLSPIQERIDYITKQSSIKDIPFENMANEAARLKQQLDTLYDEGKQDSDEYVIAQMKIWKLLDAQMKAAGGVKGSGAKNADALRQSIIDSWQKQTGVDFSGTIDKMFSGETSAIINNATGRLKSLREVVGELYQYQGRNGAIGGIAAKEDIERLMSVNRIIAFINTNIEKIKSSATTSNIQLFQDKDGQLSFIENVNNQLNETAKKVEEIQEKVTQIPGQITIDQYLRELSKSDAIGKKKDVEEKAAETIVSQQQAQQNKETAQSANESAQAINKESDALNEVKKTAEKASEAKKKFSKANKEVSESAEKSSGNIVNEANALQTVANQDLSLVLKKDSEEFKNASAEAHKYFVELGEIASITKQVGTYTNKKGDTTLKTSYRIVDVNGHNVTLDPRGNLLGEKETINIEGVYKDYLKVQEQIYNLNKKEEQGNQLTSVQLQQKIKLEEELKKLEEEIKDNRQKNLIISEYEEEILKRRAAYTEDLNKTKIDAQITQPLDEYEKKLEQIDTPKAFLKRTDAYKNSINEIKTLLAELRQYQALDILSNEDIQQADVLKNRLDELFKEVSNMSKAANQAKASSLLSNITDYISKNTKLTMSKEGRGYLAELQQLQQMLQNPGLTAPGLQSIADNFNKIQARIREASLAGKSFFDIFRTKFFYQGIQQLSFYFSFRSLIRYGRTAINTIKELDTALVDLRKTAKMSASELDGFYKSSNKVAKQMGVTTKEIISQASAWSRLGYNTADQAEKMAALSSQFASISPEMDVSAATDGLVSSMKAFDISVGDVQRDIMDNINRIGNTAATSNKEIVDMLTRSSAAMSAANNTIQETIALETAAVEITRNAETTGTAFKTGICLYVWKHAYKHIFNCR